MKEISKDTKDGINGNKMTRRIRDRKLRTASAIKAGRATQEFKVERTTMDPANQFF